MIKDWLDYKDASNGKYVFKLFHITEKKCPDERLINFLKEKIILSYRSIELYKFALLTATEDQIKEYIKKYVVPSDENQIVKNVRQGDWGEILTALIAAYFQNLEVPINKLKWKFNKDRSVFCTDLLAHNKGDKISELHYYEIKTRLSADKKEKLDKHSHPEYITVLAHNSLLKDQLTPKEAIADFLMREHFEQGNFTEAKKFNDIVLNPTSYSRSYELFFIIEKSKFIPQIIDELNSLPPSLTPLNLSIIFIDNLKQLIDNSWNDIENNLVKILNAK